MRDKTRENKYLTDPPLCLSRATRGLPVFDQSVGGSGGRCNRSATPDGGRSGHRRLPRRAWPMVFGNSTARAMGRADTAGASCRRFVVSAKKKTVVFSDTRGRDDPRCRPSHVRTFTHLKRHPTTDTRPLDGARDCTKRRPKKGRRSVDGLVIGKTAVHETNGLSRKTCEIRRRKTNGLFYR